MGIRRAPERTQAFSETGVPRRRRWVVWLSLSILAAAGAALALWWSTSSTAIDITKPEPDDIPDPVVLNPGYVGPQACSECHAKRVTEFLTTPHARACRVARAGDMPAGFEPGLGIHQTRVPGLRFEMRHAGDDFTITAIRANPAGEERSTSHINLVYGANKADEVFFCWHGNRLYEQPVVWLHPLERWANITLAESGAGDFSRSATRRCLECHNTFFEHATGTPNQYRPEIFLLGVTCERCHGPGSEHVAFHRAHPGVEDATGIIRPDLLERERQIEVCAQCHSNAIKPRGPAFSYRPGEKLDEHFRTIQTKHPEDDHVANQVHYLRQSKCFQKSDMTCITCHDPHRPHAPGDAGSARRSCAKCHQPTDCLEQPRLPVAVRGDCAACHMPQRIWMNVHFHTDDDQYVPAIRRFQHRIAVHPEATREVLLSYHRGQPGEASRREAERLEKELVEYWLRETEKRRVEYRFLGAIGAAREALRVSPVAEARRKLEELVGTQVTIDTEVGRGLGHLERMQFAEAIEAFEKILVHKPDHALAHGRLGTAYASVGQRALALEHLKAAARYDPDDPYGDSMLGWLAYLDGRTEDADAAYRRADEVEPFNAPISYRWGLVLLQRGRIPEAAERFRKALAANPNDAGACQGLAHALRQQGQAAEAVRYARRAARLTDFRNADVLISLTDAYADVGRLDEARDAAAKALAVAEGGAPEVVLQIRRRLEELKGRPAHEAGRREAGTDPGL
jgi:tetratricopeptide (TPR) repeat protein